MVGREPIRQHQILLSCANNLLSCAKSFQSLLICPCHCQRLIVSEKDVAPPKVRFAVLEWAKEGKVVGVLAVAFEDVLYKRYRP
jgi:hypothetical protein